MHGEELVEHGGCLQVRQVPSAFDHGELRARDLTGHRRCGGAAHLPGMIAAKTILPVLGVPVESKALQGIDSLLSIVQMPAGVPVGTLAIGKPGAINAALLAASIVAINRPDVRERLRAFRAEQTNAVLAQPDPAASE